MFHVEQLTSLVMTSSHDVHITGVFHVKHADMSEEVSGARREVPFAVRPLTAFK